MKEFREHPENFKIVDVMLNITGLGQVCSK